MSHTPGPWFVTSGGLIRALERGQPGATIADFDQGMHSLYSMAEGEIEANGRLIAAAPDLLAACEALQAVVVQLADIVPSGVVDEVIGEASAAISKARGTP